MSEGLQPRTEDKQGLLSVLCQFSRRRQAARLPRRCTLYAVCCTLHAAHCTLHATRYTARYTLHCTPGRSSRGPLAYLLTVQASSSNPTVCQQGSTGSLKSFACLAPISDGHQLVSHVRHLP
ncbi:hypothetical protein K504DRAFT_239540 [Pleomassaria siparia CBS 279.74]|uniref:Uncharacterized protein n=1 Tax=Pleomassaria siparia CBS 279.74 TaxID=1314801 RepID=A0A6G1KDN5_9PLEO|nr:hypothetical protein K504DRAFT_239540 [Pleomassaria siparia CBS 279.74]